MKFKLQVVNCCFASLCSSEKDMLSVGEKNKRESVRVAVVRRSKNISFIGFKQQNEKGSMLCVPLVELQ